MDFKYDVIVIGAGHAGCEAAAAAANLGSKTCLITMDMNKIGQMSCNPAIGGIAKGQIVREIDALGGEMGRNADKSLLQIKMLNSAKGPAVRALRAQADKITYPKNMIETLNNTPNLEIKEALVEDLIVEDNKVKGIRLERILEYILKEKKVEDISDLMLPIAIPTVNLKTGEIVYFSNIDIDNKNNREYSTRWCLIEENTNYEDEPKYIKGGKLASIVRASCSVPGIFVPKRINDDIYIDGGVRVNSPIDILRKMGADKIIVVTFNCNKGNNIGIENVIGISSQAFNIMSHESNKDKVELADVNIKLCLNNVSLLDFSNATNLAYRGYNIIANNIDRIKKSLNLDIKEEQG